MYNFIYSSSNIYAPYCLTSMGSLLRNNPELTDVNFFILSNDISQMMEERMRMLCDSFHAKLTVVKCEAVIRSIFAGGGYSKL